ncbi:hypothetical protein [Streptomyces sp. SGAir0957]
MIYRFETRAIDDMRTDRLRWSITRYGSTKGHDPRFVLVVLDALVYLAAPPAGHSYPRSGS